MGAGTPERTASIVGSDSLAAGSPSVDSTGPDPPKVTGCPWGGPIGW